MSLHRSTSYHGWWLILILFAFFFGVIGFGVWMIGQSFFPWRSHGAEIEFVVAPGESARTIGRNLKAANIIESSFLFETYAAIRGVAPKFQAGTFRLPQRISLLAAVNVLTGGKAESTTVTIPEGWTAEEIATRLEARGVVAKAEFLQTLQQKQFSHSYPGYGTPWQGEGFLFPDTYQFRKGMTADAVILILNNNFDRRFDQDLRQDIASQRRTIFDVVRLASIIEREVASPEDRALVAGIFLKRIEIGMALQSDATLNYATGNNSRALSATELAIDSPYNTYKYRGLPPTPIGNPGLDTIRSVVYPRISSYLYFLSGKDGKTYFAKTLAEHVENKYKYLK